MEPIPEELVDEIRNQMAGLSEDAAYEESIEVSKQQPEILSFIVELTEDLDEDFRGFAFYMFFVIYRVFENGYGKKIDPVASVELIKFLEDNEKLMESLEGTNEEFFENVAKVQMSSQPYIIRYVVETLFDEFQDENSIFLGEEDIGYLFLIMKTIIDVLNKMTDP